MLSKHIQIWTGAALTLTLLAGPGCRTQDPPGSGYVPAEEEGVMTVGLDDHDYDVAANGIVREFLMRGLPQGYTVALGPVDTSECAYDVRVRQLQQSLKVAFNREGTLKFMVAVDAMAGNSAVEEIYKIIQFNWQKNDPIDVEDLQTLGQLSNITGILFGRVSCLERPMRDGGTEMSYRFVWELANTKTGVLDLSHEQRIRKNVR